MSYTDLLFVFCFLPIYVILTVLIREPRNKNLASLIMSTVFIAWSRPIYYVYILAAVFLVYLSARLCEGGRLVWLRISAGAFAALTSVAAAVSLSMTGTVKGAVSAAGFLLFSLRAAIYLKESKTSAEKNFLDLAVYLMSFEFMAVSPVYSYGEIKDGIKKREPELALLSSGLERYICGLAAVTLLGYPLDALRTAALQDGSLPVGDIILGVIFSALELYTVCIGTLSMSEGILLVGGYRIPLQNGCIRPKSLVIDNIGAVSPSYSAAFSKLTDGLSPAAVAISSACLYAVAGISLGFGASAVSLIGIVIACALLQKLFETQKSKSAAVFTAISFAAGIILFASGSLFGFINLTAKLFGGGYGFLISAALWERLPKGIIYAVAAAVYISPLRPLLGSVKRRLMTKDENSYGAVRLVSTALVTVLLIASTVSMVGAVK